MIGQQFDRITVKSHAGRDKHGFNKWLCVCSCGNVVTVLQGSLKRGATKSCGCLNRERSALRLSKSRFKHGHALAPEFRTREYRSWEAAKRRCFNSADPKYRIYGARGITMCPEWAANFLAFFAHVGPAPSGCTIDRIDVDGNYEPGNVRWADAKTQRHNQRNKSTRRNTK